MPDMYTSAQGLMDWSPGGGRSQYTQTLQRVLLFLSHENVEILSWLKEKMFLKSAQLKQCWDNETSSWSTIRTSSQDKSVSDKIGRPWLIETYFDPQELRPEASVGAFFPLT